MADELTQEEKDAAAAIDAESAGEKTKMEKIDETLNVASELLKSVVKDKEEEAEEEKKDEEIDYSSIDPVEMAKSLVEDEDRDKTVDFISKLAKGCNVLPQDMYSEDGEPFIDEEMMKSITESEEKGHRALSAIMYSMQESNERNAKVADINMQLMSTLTKSIQDQNAVMAEMQKSLVSPETETEDPPAAEPENPLPDQDANDKTPLSQDTAGIGMGMEKSFSEDQMLYALEKSFPGTYNNVEEQAKRFKYNKLYKDLGFETFMSQLPMDEQQKVRSNLPN